MKEAETLRLGSYQEKMGNLVRFLATVKKPTGAKTSSKLARLTSDPVQARLFTEENRQKRAEKLDIHLQILKESFSDLSGWIDQFTQATFLEPFANVTDDADKFLVWLGTEKRISAEQNDWITYQRACHALEGLARQHRRQYLEFHDKKYQPPGHKPKTLHLNPVRVIIQFHTHAIIDEDMKPPSDLLLFAYQGEIHNMVVADKAMFTWFRILQDHSPCTTKELFLAISLEQREAALEFLGSLNEVGLLAYEETR